MSLFKEKFGSGWQLAKENRHLLIALIITLFVALVYYFAWTIPQTYADSTHIGFEVGRMDNHMWWANDARDYRDTGDFFFGNSETQVLNRRPWFYPFVVGFLRAITPADPDITLWAFQLILWLLTIIFIFLATERATGKILLAILAAALYWTHPSPIALTFHGLSETFNTFLLSILVYFLFDRRAENENRDYWLIFLFSLLLVTKPTYQIQLGLFLLYLLVKSFKKWRFWQFWGKIALALLPLWIQFVITWLVMGTPIISDVAGHTLKYWTVTRVYARVEGVSDLHQVATVIEDWERDEQIDYLLDHKLATAATYFHNLVYDGLVADSYVIVNNDNTMDVALTTLNKSYFALHLFMLPLMGYLLLFNTKGKWDAIWIIYLTFLIQILASGVSADQGDRLIITALPLWIVSYVFVFSRARLTSTEA